MGRVDLELIVKLGVLDHHRTWLSGDAHLLKAVRSKKNSDGIILDTVQKICVAYNVRRGLKKKEDFDPIPQIVEFLNRQNFDCGLSGKKQICVDLSQMLAKDKLLANKESQNTSDKTKSRKQKHWLSGASKLVWFWAPDKWTMYDNLAALGINAKGQNSVKGCTLEPKHFESFYSKVEQAGFDYFCDELKKNSALSVLALRPERIFDKILLVKGLTHGFSRKGDGGNRKNHEFAKMKFQHFHESLLTFESLLADCQKGAIKDLVEASSNCLKGKI